jgi:excinuclease UvrABC nuclease subunit
LYVGKTKGSLRDRLTAHLWVAKSKTPSLLSLYINDAGAQHIGIESVDTATNKQELSEKEMEWIAKLEPHFNVMSQPSHRNYGYIPN